MNSIQISIVLLVLMTEVIVSSDVKSMSLKKMFEDSEYDCSEPIRDINEISLSCAMNKWNMVFNRTGQLVSGKGDEQGVTQKSCCFYFEFWCSVMSEMNKKCKLTDDEKKANIAKRDAELKKCKEASIKTNEKVCNGIQTAVTDSNCKKYLPCLHIVDLTSESLRSPTQSPPSDTIASDTPTQSPPSHTIASDTQSSPSSGVTPMVGTFILVLFISILIFV